MQQQYRFGRLSLDGKRLLLDGNPVEEGQSLVVTIGEGKIVGRAMMHPKNGWYLDTIESYGHTYLNIPLNSSHMREITARFC